MSEGKTILIIEDDQEISKLLSVILTKLGMASVVAYSGTEGLLQLENNTYDLILLDLMLPGLSGEELIKQVREESTIPIIVISAKVDIENKVQVLKMGADDYITKPFNQAEVVARVEVQLRKSSAHPARSAENVWRGLKINQEKRSVSLENKELQLTNAEFDILSLFVSHPERAFSKKEIYERIWKGTYLGDDNTISVHVSNLRKKMAEFTSDEYIKTIWGVGFMLV
ncbi:DNA-binding response regulator [Virgibacillus profundi]|uniref:DNA-binding response regulator n=1 Tax=Virgibacillus profundi TaxID=2024555 RepID=A0A2A2IEN6_9BACI|nr:response regulator transcription factor [Virgibacillus profundi]PAV29828.1 DNA-binding response regulator [Virgibacillus profundi]PXY53999.1 DNA-binding response regulator [Virgibacillus profundi]